jgi:uncharacterized RDD family membrane protein YckC
MSATATFAALALPDYALSGWWRRVFAQLIDGLIVVVGFMAVLELGVALSPTSGVATVCLVLGLIWYVLYFVIGHGSKSGQTLGKKAFGIAVKGDEAGTRIGYGRSFARFLTLTFFGIVPILNVFNVLMPVWDRDNQALHDKVVDTVVVRT